jgi:hypothetical protein
LKRLLFRLGGFGFVSPHPLPCRLILEPTSRDPPVSCRQRLELLFSKNSFFLGSLLKAIGMPFLGQTAICRFDFLAGSPGSDTQETIIAFRSFFREECHVIRKNPVGSMSSLLLDRQSNYYSILPMKNSVTQIIFEFFRPLFDSEYEMRHIMWN